MLLTYYIDNIGDNRLYIALLATITMISDIMIFLPYCNKDEHGEYMPIDGVL
jgi:hypothetical protein